VIPLKRYAKLAVYQPGKPIEEVRRELGLRDVIKLASNENPLGPSPKAVAAARRALASAHRYPEGSAPLLRERLVKAWGLRPDQFVLGNGSNEILIFAAQAYCGPGQAIAFSARSFAVYEIAAHLCGARPRLVPSPDFCHDLDGLAKASRGAKVVFVCNPNNPTGSWHGPTAIGAFLAKVPRDTLVVLDEAYAEFSGDSFAQDKAWLRKHPNLLVCRTFSKIYGLAGLRVGYGVAGPEVCAALEKCRQPFNLNSIAQKAATAALDDRAFVKKTLATNAQGMRQITAAFERHGIWFMPSKTNFIFFRQAKAGLCDFLLKKGVIVRPIFGPYLRVSIGRASENARFIRALEAHLA
jgi:histidinol-phosphate aminotransferase